MTKMLMRIDPTKCRLSGECIKICPQQAIFIKDGKAAIDLTRCDLDGMCIPSCPMEAISMHEAD
jgi:ferredoxin